MNALSAATAKGLVKACHDCSEGGIGVAAAEMAFAGGLGMTLNLDKVPLGENIERNDFILFSESNSRFIVEVAPKDTEKFERIMKNVDCAVIGVVTTENKLKVNGRRGTPLISVPIKKLKEAWQQPLRW
jgi:phosphoribosylformylglycinamidine synthase